jgi:pullulanase
MKRLSLLAIAWLAGANVAPAFASEPDVAECNAAESTRVLAPAKSSATDARAYWLDAQTLQWPGQSNEGTFVLRGTAPLPPLLAGEGRGGVKPEVDARFKFIAPGPRFHLPASIDPRQSLRDDLRLVHLAPDGRELDATHIQLPGALDALYAEKADKLALGANIEEGGVTFTLWAPTARNVALCTYASPAGDATALHPMQRDADTGAWRATTPSDTGPYFLYLVDVHVPGTGLVRNRVTDPYSVALAANGTRSLVADLDAAHDFSDWGDDHAHVNAWL